ncbi:MAG: MFS transporter, partial [Acidobacteria bacterium]
MCIALPSKVPRSVQGARLNGQDPPAPFPSRARMTHDRRPMSHGAARSPWLMLGLLAAAEFLGMTLWFSATAVTAPLSAQFNLSNIEAAWLTMGVQGGFVAGALLSAFLNLPDVLATRRLFAVGCVLGAVATAAITRADTAGEAILLRVATGAALAWVYPTGLKIAAGWFRERRGTALAWLVAALTVGQAFPHLLASL